MIYGALSPKAFDEVQILYNKVMQLKDIYGADNLTIIHGDAPGADSIAGAVGEQAGIPVDVYPALWKKYGRAAGPIRNMQMLTEGRPDWVYAFHNDIENSKGTKNMIEISHKAGIPVVLCTLEGEINYGDL